MNIGKSALHLAVGLLVGCATQQRDFSRGDAGAQGGAGGALGAPTGTSSGSEAGPDGQAPGDGVPVPGVVTPGDPPPHDDTEGPDDGVAPDGPRDLTPSPTSLGGAGGIGNPTPSASGGNGSTPALGSAGAAGAGSTPELLADGVSCTQGSQCASSYCVDGVCCESVCDGLCAECAAAGTEGVCTPTEFDADCGDLQCPSDTECRSYQKADELNCAALGECLSGASCDPLNATAGTSCQAGAGSCDGGGECVVPDKLTLGQACGDDAECGSGHCAASASGAKLCCNEACSGVCQACASDGFCDASPADDSRCAAVMCPADTTCANYPPDLTSDRCTGFGQCAQAASYCRPSYASATTSCGTGRFCDGMGNCENACTSAQLWCGNACINPNTDEQNCGGCGVACPGTSQCVSGDCECQGANELLCGNACIDVSSNVSNCGACGNSCPNVPGSTRTCKNGQCGSCGAYTEECCAGGTCGSGLACNGGTCECAAGTHRCSALNACYSNNDVDHCGPACVDCHQPNAVAVCGGSGCANTCNSGVVLLCAAGADGKPSCGDFNFESGTTEGWRYDLSIDGHASTNAPTVSNEASALGGAHSLAIQFDPAKGYQVWVYGTLCSGGQGVDISARDFSLQIMMKTAPDSPVSLAESTGSIFPLSYAGPGHPSGSFAVVANLSDMVEGTWLTYGSSVASMFGTVANTTDIGLNIAAGDWKGTVYIDRVQINP